MEPDELAFSAYAIAADGIARRRGREDLAAR
jgi:hypothetical protein